MHQHNFIPSEIPEYERCATCNTLHRLGEINYSQLYGDQYWDKESIRSSLEGQCHNLTNILNDAGESKIDSVLKYLPGGECAIELACAPGSLLAKLAERYEKVIGIEYDEFYRERIRAICGEKPVLIFEPFPKATMHLPAACADCLVGMDILEHSNEPEEFIAEIHRLLKPNGIAVLMAPILLMDGLARDCDKHPEHAYLHTEDGLRDLLGDRFEIVTYDRFVTGHEIVVMRYPV